MGRREDSPSLQLATCGDPVTCLHAQLGKIGATSVDLRFEGRKAQSARAADNGDPFGIDGKH
jgi:hypothetical protein